MRPYENPRLWRKQQRVELRGVPRGRRSSHHAKTQASVPGSSWIRRHPGEWPPHLLRRFGGSR